MMDFCRWVALVVLVGTGLAAVGCEKPLFPDNQPRTPYDRYMSLHGETRAMNQENAFGGTEPNLRERLKPLDEE